VEPDAYATSTSSCSALQVAKGKRQRSAKSGQWSRSASYRLRRGLLRPPDMRLFDNLQKQIEPKPIFMWLPTVVRGERAIGKAVRASAHLTSRGPAKTFRSCGAGGTRDQRVRMVSRPCRVFRSTLPVTTRWDQRKPISWKYRSACCGLM
jgi:hypothetical protein